MSLYNAECARAIKPEIDISAGIGKPQRESKDTTLTHDRYGSKPTSQRF
jgi:hypothetical protein